MFQASECIGTNYKTESDYEEEKLSKILQYCIVSLNWNIILVLVQFPVHRISKLANAPKSGFDNELNL